MTSRSFKKEKGCRKQQQQERHTIEHDRQQIGKLVAEAVEAHHRVNHLVAIFVLQRQRGAQQRSGDLEPVPRILQKNFLEGICDADVCAGRGGF